MVLYLAICIDLPHWSARQVSGRYFTCNGLIGQPNIFITGGKFDQAFGTSEAKVHLSHNMVVGGGILYNITCGISVSLRAVGPRWKGCGASAVPEQPLQGKILNIRV